SSPTANGAKRQAAKTREWRRVDSFITTGNHGTRVAVESTGNASSSMTEPSGGRGLGAALLFEIRGMGVEPGEGLLAAAVRAVELQVVGFGEQDAQLGSGRPASFEEIAPLEEP